MGLNANAQSFTPVSSVTPRSNKLSVITELEPIPESPMVSPAIPPSQSAEEKTTKEGEATQQQSQQQQLVSSTLIAPSLPNIPMPQFYDSLALIPAIDQNGLLVMIPPSLIAPGSLFTPLSIFNSEITENTDTDHPNFVSPIADMQSLLGFDPSMPLIPNHLNALYNPNYDPSQHRYISPMNGINYSPFPTSPSYKEFIDANGSPASDLHSADNTKSSKQ